MYSRILDFYDDSKGSVLTALMPERSTIPDFVKTAEAVPRDAHPSQFAVVMVDGEDVHPRYPISDAGNAWLSAVYFHSQHDQMPGEIQKVAAVRIKGALEHYGLPTTDVIEKLAEAEGPVHDHIVNLADTVEEPRSLDLQDESTRDEVQHALSSGDGQPLYRLSNAEDAMTASRYFDTHRHDFEPRERREFAVKTAAALDRAGLPIPQHVADYSGDGFNPRLKGYLDVRYAWLVNTDDGDAIEQLHKVAAQRGTVDPETFAQNLETFDRNVGLDAAWDTHIPDPWFSTFFSIAGMRKTAAEEVAGPEKVYHIDTESVTDADLKWLAANGRETLLKQFKESVVDSFCKEPCAVFKSMPKPQKVILARMTRDQ